MDMRSVLAKIAESLEGTVSLDVESLTDQFSVLAEDHVKVEPEVWQRAGRAINQHEYLRLRYQRFDGITRDYAVEPYHLVAYHGNWYLQERVQASTLIVHLSNREWTRMDANQM